MKPEDTGLGTSMAFSGRWVGGVGCIAGWSCAIETVGAVDACMAGESDLKVSDWL